MEQFISITKSLFDEVQLIVFAYTLEDVPLGNDNWIMFSDVLRMFSNSIELNINFESFELAFVKAKILNPKVNLEFTLDLSRFIKDINHSVNYLEDFPINQVDVYEEYLYYDEHKFPTDFDRTKVNLVANSVGKLLPALQSDTILTLHDLKNADTLKVKWIDKINSLDISSQQRLICLPDNDFLKLKVSLSLIVVSNGIDYDMIQYFLTRAKILEIEFDIRSPKLFNSNFCIFLSRLKDRIHGNFSNIIWPLNVKAIELFKLAHPPLRMKLVTAFDSPVGFKLFSDIKNANLIDLDVTNMNSANLINSNITQLRIKTDTMDFCNLTRLSKLYSLQIIEGSEGHLTLDNIQLPKQLTELAVFSDSIDHSSNRIPLPKFLQILTTNTSSLSSFGFLSSRHLTELVLTNVSNTSESDRFWNNLPESLEALTIHQRMMFDLVDAQRDKRFGLKIPDKLSHLTIHFPYSPGNRIYCINMDKPTKEWFHKKKVEIEGIQFWIRIDVSKNTKVKLVLDDQTRDTAVMSSSNEPSAGSKAVKIRYYHYVLCPSNLEDNVEVSGVGTLGEKYNNKWIDKGVTLFYNGPPVMKILYNNLFILLMIVFAIWFGLNWLKNNVEEQLGIY